MFRGERLADVAATLSRYGSVPIVVSPAAADLPAHVVGDAQKIRQVLDNLVARDRIAMEVNDDGTIFMKAKTVNIEGDLGRMGPRARQRPLPGCGLGGTRWQPHRQPQAEMELRLPR